MTHEDFLKRLTGDLEKDLLIWSNDLQVENESYIKTLESSKLPNEALSRRVSENNYAWGVLHQLRAWSARKRKEVELSSQKIWEIVEISDDHKSHFIKPELTKTDPVERNQEALMLLRKYPWLNFGSVRRLSDGTVFKSGDQVYIESDTYFNENGYNEQGRINATINYFMITENNLMHVITGSRYGSFYIDNIHKS